MKDESTEIEELRERVKLLREILELKKQIAELEDEPVHYPFRYRCEPYPNGTPWFPDTWSDTTTCSPQPGDVFVIS